MKVESKFNLGEKVFFLDGITVASGKIERISWNISIEDNDVFIVYTILNDEYIEQIPENLIFKNIEALINKISQNVKFEL